MASVMLSCNMFVIVVNGFAIRRKAFADCCPGYKGNTYSIVIVRRFGQTSLVYPIFLTHVGTLILVKLCIVILSQHKIMPLQPLIVRTLADVMIV